MKVLLVSDSTALGLMETRPEPAWRVRLTNLRNKDLLAPDYGAMHVAAYLKQRGRSLRVCNLVADVHDDISLFEERNIHPDELSAAPIGGPKAPKASRDYLFDTLASYQPDVVLVTLSIYNLALYSRKLLGEIKEAAPDSTLVTGGIYSTLHSREILGDGSVDIVVRGEGEITTTELLDAIESGGDISGIAGISFKAGSRIVVNPARKPVTPLDSLPHLYNVSSEFRVRTRFELLSGLNPEDDYIPGAGFLTSRGCPERCAFCLDPAINNGRTRFHSPGYVRDVLSFCSSNFPGARGFFFGDATFTMNKKRLKKILDLIRDLPYSYQIQTRADYLDEDIIERLASTRFTNVAIGAESFNQRILEEVAKKRLRVDDVLAAVKTVREYGMKPVLTFIAGLPGETRSSIERTVQTLLDNELYTSTFFPLVVFRGTELYDLFQSTASPADIESARLNPYSEEFIYTSEEFPTPEELKTFTEGINRTLVEARPPGW